MRIQVNMNWMKEDGKRSGRGWFYILRCWLRRNGEEVHGY